MTDPANDRNAEHSAAAPLSDEVLLGICRMQADHEDAQGGALDWMRAAETVIRLAAPRGLPERFANAAPALSAAMAWARTFVASETIDGAHWVRSDDLTHCLTQMLGLIQPEGASRRYPFIAARALGEALNQGLLDAKDHDAWRPGMRSGAGRCQVVSATEYGCHLAWEEYQANAGVATGEEAATAEVPADPDASAELAAAGPVEDEAPPGHPSDDAPLQPDLSNQDRAEDSVADAEEAADCDTDGPQLQRSEEEESDLESGPSSAGGVAPESTHDQPPRDPIPLTWLRENVPQRTVKGDASKLADWIRRRKVRVFQIAGKNHAEREDLLRWVFQTHKRVCEMIEAYDASDG